jgi:hypothetical protein
MVALRRGGGWPAPRIAPGRPGESSRGAGQPGGRGHRDDPLTTANGADATFARPTRPTPASVHELTHLPVDGLLREHLAYESLLAPPARANLGRGASWGPRQPLHNYGAGGGNRTLTGQAPWDFESRAQLRLMVVMQNSYLQMAVPLNCHLSCHLQHPVAVLHQNRIPLKTKQPSVFWGLLKWWRRRVGIEPTIRQKSNQFEDFRFCPTHTNPRRQAACPPLHAAYTDVSHTGLCDIGFSMISDSRKHPLTR